MYTIIFILGVIIFAASVWHFKNIVRLIKNGRITTATVKEIEVSKNSEGDDIYKAVFLYTSQDNRRFLYTESAHSQGKRKPGDTAEIVYYPGTPFKARLLTYHEAFRTVVIFLIAGLMMIVSGTGHFVFELWLNHWKSTIV